MEGTHFDRGCLVNYLICVWPLSSLTMPAKDGMDSCFNETVD